MIHIDELFRQRMEDREASPKPGAWSNMRELLDKELPLQPAGTNWRRVFGYFTGLLLLASASVGGYSLYTGQLQSDMGTAPIALRASNTGISTGVAAAPATQGDASAARPSGKGTSVRTGATGGSAGNAAASAAFTSSVAASVPDRQVSQRATTGNGASGAAYGKRNIASLQGPAQPAGLPTSTTGLNGTRPATGSGTANPERTAGSAQAAAPGSTATANGKHNRELILASGVSGSNTVSDATPRDLEPVALQTLQSGMSAARPAAPALRILDTIQRIEIVTRRSYAAGSRKPVYRLDTLPAELIIVERLVAASVAQPATVATTTPKKVSGDNAGKIAARTARTGSGAESPLTAMNAGTRPATKAAAPSVIPAATLDAASTDANATANEVAARLSGSRMNFWQSLRLDERLEKAKVGMQSIEFYPGVIAGINATVLTPNTLGGFQLGLTSLLAINEWWSVLGEVKYMYRFNTGSSVRDDYMSVRDLSESNVSVNGKAYRAYEWKEANVQHYFNYETVQTLEIPLMLRYNNSRFSTQAGVNFVSSRPISVREITSDPSEFKARRELIPDNQTLPSLNPVPTTTPAIRSADFGNRFGMGYVVGAAYSFTPAVYMDLRLTQTFWDNAKSEGARQISKDLLRNPSFQLSLGYRFGTAKQRD